MSVIFIDTLEVGLMWPDTRECLFSLLDGRQFAGHPIKVCYRLSADYLDQAKAGTAAVLIYPLGGTEGAVDRVDRLGVDVYGIGTQSMDVARAITRLLVPNPYYPARHDTPVGYVDDVGIETVPVDVPFADPMITQTQAVYRMTVRPTV